MLPPALCSFDGCGKVAAPHRPLCWGHFWQKRKGQPLRPLRPWRRPAHENLKRNALRYAEAEGDDEFRKAREALRKAAKRYTLKRR